jgi:uncharacterized protein with HEPN domain
MMKPKSPKWLEDIADNCQFILEATSGASKSDFDNDRQMRHAVERSLSIIGEALHRLERTDPETVARIGNYRSAIGLRNRLAHEYDDIDNDIVWDVIENSLPTMKREADALVREAEIEFFGEDSQPAHGSGE